MRPTGPEPRLQLEWHGDAQVVVDTRSGNRLEHEVAPVGVRVLEALADPLSMSRLAGALDDVLEPELERQVADLREANLLFEEDERFMSLLIGADREQGYL